MVIIDVNLSRKKANKIKIKRDNGCQKKKNWLNECEFRNVWSLHKMAGTQTYNTLKPIYKYDPYFCKIAYS